MYIEDWDTFFLQAQELQRKRPLHTRYCIKYSHKEGKLVLKVTDDLVVSCAFEQQLVPPLLSTTAVLMPGMRVGMQCLQYKTDQQLDIKRMEKLNTIFFAMMAKGEYDPGKDGLISWRCERDIYRSSACSGRCSCYSEAMQRANRSQNGFK